MSRWLHVNTSLPPGATLAPSGPPASVPGSQLASMKFAQREGDVARVGHRDLVVDGLADFAVEFGRRAAAARARDLLELLDREARLRFGATFDVFLVLAALADDAVGVPVGFGAELVHPGGQRRGDRCWSHEEPLKANFSLNWKTPSERRRSVTWLFSHFREAAVDERGGVAGEDDADFAHRQRGLGQQPAEGQRAEQREQQHAAPRAACPRRRGIARLGPLAISGAGAAPTASHVSSLRFPSGRAARSTAARIQP